MYIGEEWVRIFTTRHTARDTADAWNKAFRAARALGRAGYPANTKVSIGTYTAPAAMRLGEI